MKKKVTVAFLTGRSVLSNTTFPLKLMILFCLLLKFIFTIFSRELFFSLVRLFSILSFIIVFAFRGVVEINEDANINPDANLVMFKLLKISNSIGKCVFVKC